MHSFTSLTYFQIRGFGFGDIFKDQLIKLRPRSMEVDSEGDKVSHIHTCWAHSFLYYVYITNIVITVLLLLRKEVSHLGSSFSSGLVLQHRKWF